MGVAEAAGTDVAEAAAVEEAAALDWHAGSRRLPRRPQSTDEEDALADGVDTSLGTADVTEGAGVVDEAAALVWHAGSRRFPIKPQFRDEVACALEEGASEAEVGAVVVV